MVKAPGPRSRIQGERSPPAGGDQERRIRPRAGTFIPMMPICFSTASGSRLSMKLKWCLSAALTARRMVSKGKRRTASASTAGSALPGQPRKRTSFCSRACQQAERAVAAAVVGLRGEEGFRAAALHHLADVPLAPALGAAVHGGGVDVVDAEVEGARDDGDGRGVVIRLLDGRLAAETENAGAVAGAAQVAGGHGLAGGGVLPEPPQ